TVETRIIKIPPADLDPLITAVVFRVVRSLRTPPENVQNTKTNFEPDGCDVPTRIPQAICHVILKMIMRVARSPHEKRVIGWITEKQIRIPLICGLRVKTDQPACSRLDESFRHGTT